MINLLPKIAHAHARGEYRVRFLSLLFFAAAAACIAGAALLLPAYFFAGVERTTVLNQDSLVEQTLAQQNLSDAAQSEKTSSGLFTAASKILTMPRPSVDIVALLQTRGSGIVLHRIDYAPGTAAAAVHLSGVALTRDALLTFKQSLSDMPGVSKLDLPLSSLVVANDIPFTISFSYIAAPASAATSSTSVASTT